LGSETYVIETSEEGLKSIPNSIPALGTKFILLNLNVLFKLIPEYKAPFLIV